MQEKTRLALAPVSIAAFLLFAGMSSNCDQAAEQSSEESSKPPAPVRPPGTTGAPAALPEILKGIGHQIQQNAAELDRQKREFERLKKQEDLEKSQREIQTEPNVSPSLPSSEPPDPLKP